MNVPSINTYNSNIHLFTQEEDKVTIHINTSEMTRKTNREISEVNDFICPIRLDWIREAAMLSCGHFFEKEAIEEEIRIKGWKCPMSCGPVEERIQLSKQLSNGIQETCGKIERLKEKNREKKNSLKQKLIDKEDELIGLQKKSDEKLEELTKELRDKNEKIEAANERISNSIELFMETANLLKSNTYIIAANEKENSKWLIRKSFEYIKSCRLMPRRWRSVETVLSNTNLHQVHHNNETLSDKVMKNLNDFRKKHQE